MFCEILDIGRVGIVANDAPHDLHNLYINFIVLVMKRKKPTLHLNNGVATKSANSL